MALTLYVATSNAGKLRDFAHASGTAATILPLPGLAGRAEPVEDAETFEGNAVIKAVAYSVLAPGELVVADDSGIELDALGGAPGVRSARYALDEGFAGTPGATKDERNNQALLARAAELTGAARRARYRCVLAAARDGQVIATAAGALDGVLLEAGRGTEGFGYDPLFLLPELGRTMAELDPATKLRFSHRGRALGNLLPKLLELVPEDQNRTDAPITARDS